MIKVKAMKSNEFLKQKEKKINVVRAMTKVKATPPKSKHKHTYTDCLLVCMEQYLLHKEQVVERCYKATYCSVCGKIGNIEFWQHTCDTIYIMGTPKKVRRMVHFTTQEMQTTFPNIPIFHIEDKWKTKYVPITDIDV